RWAKKWPWPSGLHLKKRHSVLLVAHLEQPNYAPRALIGAFSGATVAIKLVLTGPNDIRGFFMPHPDTTPLRGYYKKPLKKLTNQFR
ncbi:MAG: hypothetical protein KZQ77_07880, partial [Candidatus Thiodiazotropha sp. (ex Notomyrtea botanica)]|nr:hypothetical protein [Candidatus Thiodiazotropha sp. (ex Notomyrtea botanica)]